MSQCTVFEVSIGLLDDGVPAVDLVGIRRAKNLGIDSGEERGGNGACQKGRLALRRFRIPFGDAAYDRAHGVLRGPLP